MEMSKIKLALGLVVGASLAMPMVASAAADQVVHYLEVVQSHRFHVVVK